MKLRATQNFSTVVMYRGENRFVRGVTGETIDLDEPIFELVEKELPGSLVAATTAKPKRKTDEKPTTTARQVTKAPNRKKG